MTIDLEKDIGSPEQAQAIADLLVQQRSLYIERLRIANRFLKLLKTGWGVRPSKHARGKIIPFPLAAGSEEVL